MYEKHTTSTYTRTPILVLDHLVRKTYHIYIHSDPNSGSGPPCTKNIPHLHTLGPQFWFWTTLYEKHTTSTYTRTPILVLDHLVRKTYHIYIHSDPNSGSGPPCTKNIPHLHTLGPQFWFWTTLYEKHTTSTYTRTPILVLDHLVRKTYHIYIHSDPNSGSGPPCTKNIPHLHTLGPQFWFWTTLYEKHTTSTYTRTPILVLDHLVRKTYHIYIHSDPNSGSGPPCTKNIPHLHTLGPQFWFWTTLYEKHTTSTYTRTPILVLDHLVRKTYHIYIHSDPNSGSGPPCTKNIPHLHTLGPQFWFWTTLYEKHTTSTYTRTPILVLDHLVRKTYHIYIHSDPNSGSGPPCTKNIPHLHTLGLQFWFWTTLYEKHTTSTYTRTPILVLDHLVRKTYHIYIHSDPNSGSGPPCTKNIPHLHTLGPQFWFWTTLYEKHTTSTYTRTPILVLDHLVRKTYHIYIHSDPNSGSGPPCTKNIPHLHTLGPQFWFWTTLYEKHTTSTYTRTPILVLDHLVRKTYHIYIHSDPNSGSGPPCTKNIPHLHTLGPQFWFWTTLYEKHTTSTYTRTPILVLDHLVRKTYHIYIHSDPNSGSGPPCTKNIPHLHTLGPQFWFWTTLYEKHTTSTYTRTPILVLDHLVRKTYHIYIHSDPNSGSGPPCTKNIPHLHTLGPQFWFWTTLYEKHTTSTYTRTPILVLDHLVRKTYHIYIHSDPNSGSGPPCTKNIPHLHTLGPQFWFWITLYEKHTTSTYTRTPILVLDHLVRKTYHIYIHSDPNSGSGSPCTKNIPHLHTLGPQFCMYEKHTTSTCRITPILRVRKTLFRTRTREVILHVHIWPTVRFRLYRRGGGVLDHLVRKTYHIYMHSDPNSACMKNATSKQPDSFLQMEGHLDRHCALGIPER